MNTTEPTHDTTTGSPVDRPDRRPGPIGRIGRTTALTRGLAAVIGLLIVAGIGAASMSGGEAQARPTDPAPARSVDVGGERVPRPTPAARRATPVDELVAVDGARLHVRCSGSGPVTVVLIAGFETSGDAWSAVTPTATEEARVCTYDRYGTGTSDPAPTAQTFADQADDLHAALTSLGEPGPYLVVGHSFGGPEAVTFAATYRTEVMGLLLVDATPATWPTAVCAVPDAGTAATTTYRQLCTTITTPADNAERLDGLAAFDEVARVGSLGELPTVVMTATQHPWGLDGAEDDRLDDAWTAGQDHWLSLSSSARLVPVVDAGHDIHLERPDAVVEQIRHLLR